MDQIIARYNRSFVSKLIQASDETKKYYDIIKNHLATYKLSERLSWNYETFSYKRKLLIKLAFKGKTLCAYLALEPDNFIDSKYKIEDVSKIAKNLNTKALYRIKNPRRVKYLIQLIDLLMIENTVKILNSSYVNYVEKYPFESLEDLIRKGYIREVPTVKALKSVSANEVNTLMTNEIAKESIRIYKHKSNKERKSIINIDTLSKYFKAHEHVSIEEIKNRVPGFSKVTYIKVLARGILDKPLLVEADDFSIEAVKMIVLTGGKVYNLN